MVSAMEQISNVDLELSEEGIKQRKQAQRLNCVAASLELLKKWFPRSKECRMFLVHRDFVLQMDYEKGLDGPLKVIEKDFQFDSHVFFKTDNPMGGMVGEAIRTKEPQLCDEKQKLFDKTIDIPIPAGELLFTSPVISKDDAGVAAVIC